uniref:TetR/AcrR family transcriptional regulator C-terminal domain-containing protein n=1 Tax=Paenibacillus oryzisoli TaxID=1850517 RepID=UPI003D2AAC08
MLPHIAHSEKGIARHIGHAPWKTIRRGLPQEEYPRLVEAAPDIAVCVDPDRHFAFGAELILAGVEAMAASHRPEI